MVLILMGVTASGKTTVGEELARRLEWPFADADDYHSAANREKMRSGGALTDEDRAPWLAELHSLIETWIDNGINGVLACSALRQQYRDVLAAEIEPPELRFVFLDGSKELIEARAQGRHQGFAPPSMVTPQFETLEAPADALTVELQTEQNVPKSVEELVNEILRRASLMTGEQYLHES